MVPELANRHRLTLRRVFIGPKRSVFPHYGVANKTKSKKELKKKKQRIKQAFEFRNGLWLRIEAGQLKGSGKKKHSPHQITHQ